MNSINKFINKLDNILAYFASATLFVLMMWIFLDAALRYLFNNPIVGTIEFSGEYLLIIIIYFSISYTFKHGDQVSVNFIVDKFPKNIRKYLRVFSNVFAMFVFIILGKNSIARGLELYKQDIRSSGLLDYPIAPAYIFICIGIFMITIRLLIDSINTIRDNNES